MSLLLHAPRPTRIGSHHDRILDWDVKEVNELFSVAQQLSAAEIVIKPRELHLAFNWGCLHSRKFSRFRKLKLPASRPTLAAVSRSNTMSSVMSMAMTLSTDVSVLVTRLIRRESTYIVWGAIMAVESSSVPPRNVLVKIAVDEEGGEDLREDARLHQQLADRGLEVGYYGIFVDSIGSTALVIDDFDGELEFEREVETPTPSP